MNRPIAPKKALHTARTNRKGPKLIALFTTAAFVVGGMTAGASATHAATTNDSPPTADELMNRPWFVKQDGDWFKYAKHNWYEQRREAEYQYSTTVDHPGGVIEQAKYEIQRPYYTVEHKQVYAGTSESVIKWLGEVKAQNLGDGWWAIPDSVIASVDFNPLTVADSGTVNLSSYKGPNVTVNYRKTQDLTFDQPSSDKFFITQNEQLYWNGTSWVRGIGNAEWVTEAPEGGKEIASQPVPDPDDPGWKETVYATADGGTTNNKAEAGWLTEAPEGDDWTRIGGPRYPEWNDDDPWYQVVGYEWTKGKDPTASTPDGKEQPDYYKGYEEATQRFRPVVKKWKVRFEVTPPETEQPAPQPTEQEETPKLEPSRLPAKKEPVQAQPAAGQPIEQEGVPNLEPSRLPAKKTPVQAEPAHRVPVPVRIDAGL